MKTATYSSGSIAFLIFTSFIKKVNNAIIKTFSSAEASHPILNKTNSVSVSGADKSKTLPYSLLAVIIFLFSITIGQAATRTATSSGNWNSTSTWGGSSVPTSSDNVIIENNANVTVNISNAVCASLRIGYNWPSSGPGTLSFSSTTSKLTVGDYVTLGNSSYRTGSIDMSNGGFLQIGGSFTAPYIGTFTPGSGTVEYNGSGNQSILSYSDLGNKAYYNLTANTGGTKTINAAATVTGTLTLSNGILANGTYLTMASGSTISRSQGSLSSAPTFAGTINLVYTGTSPIFTGYEMPVSTAVMNNLTTNPGGVIQTGVPGTPVNILTDAFDNLNSWTGNIGGNYNQFSATSSSNAGGTSNESRYVYANSTSINTAAIYRSVNTTGYTSLNIRWKQYIDSYDAYNYPYTIKVQCATSSSGPWTDIYSETPLTNLGPETKTYNGWTTNVGGTFYIRYYITGYTWGINYWYFDDLIIEAPTSAAPSTATVNGTLDLSNGTYSISSNTLALNGGISGGNSIVGSSSSNLSVGGSGSNLTIPSITNGLNNFTINRATGVTLDANTTVNGILNLQSANASATQGTLHTGVYILTMGTSATTTGTGDVSGIVKRTSFTPDIQYSFGSQFTTMTFAAGGTMPTDMSFKISLGASPSWKTGAIQRYFDIIYSGTPTVKATMDLHFIDSELNGNTEANLVIYDTHTDEGGIVEQHGNSNQSLTDNWVGLSNINVTYFATSFSIHQWSLANSDNSAGCTWLGHTTDWNSIENWACGHVPLSTDDVIIPNAATTAYDPTLPANTSIKSILIESGGILNGGTSTSLTITGGSGPDLGTGSWTNSGTFNAGTSTVIFTNADATIANVTDFYNVTISSGAGLTPGTNSIMRIGGTFTNVGIFYAALLNNTIEYNGTSQTVINPNGALSGYYNLILSGSGTKTLPGTALSVTKDFSLSGSASTTTGATLSVGANVTIGAGTSLNLASFSHTIAGNITNNGGNFTPSASSVTFNGSLAQTITSSAGISFNNIVLANTSADVTLGTSTNCSIAGNLTLNSGAVFDLAANNLTTLSGTVSNSGTIKTQSTSSTPVPTGKTWDGNFEYSGTAAQTIVAGNYNNLTLSGSGGVTANANI
ncbi:MAG: beta strand repeat-containing protein, partial [Paludibacter sp.]